MGKSILITSFCIVLYSCYHEDVRSCEYTECKTPDNAVFHISVYKNSDTMEYFIKNDKENEYKINYLNWNDTIVSI